MNAPVPAAKLANSAVAEAARQPALVLEGVGKSYRLYRNDIDRLIEIATGRPRHQVIHALQGIDLCLGHGEVLGIVGRNGAGKSTLLKIIAGLLPPSDGLLQVNGRVAAILELGAAFHPDMSGRENAYLTAAIAGLAREEIDALLPEIAAFADIGEFIERPVKTYSTGMAARLAFAVATAIDPDILIIDEALSVGDGAFARKSFDRIMGFRDAGKTILFCSHSLYHVESVCNAVIWLDQGQLRMFGPADDVITAYREALAASNATAPATINAPPEPLPDQQASTEGQSPGNILSVEISADGSAERPLRLCTGQSDLRIRVRLRLTPSLPPPGIGIIFMTADGLPLAGVSSVLDGVAVRIDAEGYGEARISFPRIPFLRGRYTLVLFLTCERGLHIYERAYLEDALVVEGLEMADKLGLVRIAHDWQT